jgi:hypothetical protein
MKGQTQETIDDFKKKKPAAPLDPQKSKKENKIMDKKCEHKNLKPLKTGINTADYQSIEVTYQCLGCGEEVHWCYELKGRELRRRKNHHLYQLSAIFDSDSASDFVHLQNAIFETDLRSNLRLLKEEKLGDDNFRRYYSGEMIADDDFPEWVDAYDIWEFCEDEGIKYSYELKILE